MEFDYKCDFAHCTILLVLLLFLWTWGISFFGGIQHSPVNGCSGVSCNFGVLAGENEQTSFYSTILHCHGLYSPWNSPGQNTGWLAIPFSRGSSQPRIKLRSPALQEDSLPAEPQGCPKSYTIRQF